MHEEATLKSATAPNPVVQTRLVRSRKLPYIHLPSITVGLTRLGTFLPLFERHLERQLLSGAEIHRFYDSADTGRRTRIREADLTMTQATHDAATQINLEMFEVGLGSALYLRLCGAEGDVRILADGGVGRGYKDDHVLTKLHDVFVREGVTEPRIDLMIATHYDEDHLKGLVPIVEAGIAIGDVWLPPVASEDRETSLGSQPLRKDMLGEALKTARGLIFYLRKRGREIARLTRLLERLGIEGSSAYFGELQEEETWDGPDDLINDEALEALVAPFRIAFGEAGGSEDGCEHAGAADMIEPLTHEELFARLDSDAFWRTRLYLDLSDSGELEYWANHMKAKNLEGPAIQSLQHLVKTTARKAINGAALHRLTAALARAKIVPQYRTINRGIPEDFRWNAAAKRFETASGSGVAPTQIALLGPSDWLVGKFRDRLPARTAAYMAFTTDIPVKNITPSNDLSYVLTVSHAGQTILICGDTGMWDFRIPWKGFEQKLIDRLTDVSVAQVAHHAGLNRYYYHSLLEAWQARSDAVPYLLISHAENDIHRPNQEFETFVQKTWDSNATNLLFTSQPRASRVTSIRHRLYKLRGVPEAVARCDIRMSYGSAEWSVIQHGIKV